MPYEVILDGTKVLSDQPDGLNDLEINFTRDELFKGVFVKYSTKLTFIGDGYNYLLDKTQSDGVCAKVDVQFREIVTGVSHYGTIFMQSSKFNISTCSVECAIEDDSLAQRVLRLKNQKVDVSSSKTINGEAITPIGNYVDIRWITDYPSAIQGTSPNQRICWGALETLEYLLKWCADNNITLVTNGFFASHYSNEVKKIVIGGTFTSADTITYTITTCYGVYTDTFNPATAYTTNTQLARQLSRELCNKASTNFVQKANQNFFQDRALKCNYGYEDSGDAYLVHFDAFELTVVSDGASTFTITDEQNVSYGGADTFLINGKSLLADDGADPSTLYSSDVNLITSLGEIFGQLSNLFALGLYFYKQNGVQYCQCETLFDLYTDSIIIELNEINTIEMEFDTEQQITTISTGASNGFTDWGQLNPQTFSNRSDCFSREVNGTTNWITGDQIWQNLDFLNVNDIIPFVYKASLPAGSGHYVTNFRSTYVDPSGTISPDTIINDFNPPYRISSQNCAASFIAQAWAKTGVLSLVTSKTDAQDVTLTIADAILINKVYQFIAPLSCDQLTLIENNPLSKIGFSGETGDYLSGWIKDLSYNINTGMAKIKIYST